ncbi:MAG: C25 family cysteine peptidase, partial [bacterium]
YRSDTSSSLTFNYGDSIKKDINRGSMIVNFVGHASSQDWEAGMSDPNILSNFGKLPLVFSMTCYTGRTAETYYRGFGERFTNMNNKGAIGFVGTTGWSFDYEANELNKWMFKAIKDDTLRRLGDILKKAHTNMNIDSIFFTTRHTVNCYSLIGDPACKLALPKQPEFYIDNTFYKLSNDFPSVNEPATLIIYPKNFGLNADSCKIRFQLKKNNLNYSFKDTVLKNLKYSDTVKYNFTLDSSGNYLINVNLDFSNWYPNENKTNNTLDVKLSIKNTAFIPLKPVNNSVVKTDSVEFIALNPFIKYSQNNIKVILQFDTTKFFNSSLNQTFIRNNISGVLTKFKASIPALNQNKLYYWRTNAIINNDSSGWSKIQVFSYNSIITNVNEMPLDNIGNNNVSDSGNIALYKFKNEQYYDQDFSNTYSTSTGIKLYEFAGTLFSRSLGSNGAEASYFNVINQSIFIDAGYNTGLNMLKVKKINGSIFQFKNYKMTYPNSSDSVLSFLNSFDSTYYLMALNASYVNPYPAFYPFNAATKQKMRQFGSVYADSMTQFGAFNTWSFIGFLGAASNQVSEEYHLYTNAWIQSTSSLTPTFKKTTGTLSNIIGPAQSWKDFSWQRTLLPQSNILFDVIGIDRNNLQTILLSNQSSYQLVNLNSINAYQYPQLNLLAKFSIDTISGNQSSVLNSLKVNYTPPAEIVADINSFTQSDTALKVGDKLKINLNYYNAGYVSVPGIIVNIYKSSIAPMNILNSDTINKELKVDSSGNY